MQHEMFLHRLRKIFSNYPLLFSSACLVAISACDSGPNVKSICAEHPQICSTLSEDNWCRVERRQTLFSYDALQKSNDDNDKYHLLIALEQYAKCMDKASLIEHKKLKEKKTNRINNAVNAKEMISTISGETTQSESPLLQYFHWSRYNNKEALELFLAQEDTDAVENPTSQFNYATYYIKRDIKKTINFLFHALELYKENDVINDEIFQSLTTIFLDKKQYKQAYIWLKVLTLHSEENRETNEQVLDAYAQKFSLDASFLNTVAESTLDNIKAGIFVSPKSG